ncbi:MAG TPA: histidine kinase dimerization/phosphoacceptor domain -containing protein, partial [Coleofasciculaceae cyanobacterium]
NDRIVLANQALADFFGITVKDLLNKTNYDLHTNPSDAEVCIQQDCEVITTLQKKFIPEEAFPRTTGEVRWFQTIKKPLFSNDGNVCQVLGVSTDITERKRVQEQLSRSEERLNLALEVAHMGYWDWNVQTGLVTWSEHLQQLYNLPLDGSELTYDTFLSIVHPDDRDRVRQTDYNCLETGEKLNVEFRVNLSDGRVCWIESKGQVFYDEKGNPLWMIGIDIDITKRKQAEAEIRESLQEKEILLQEIHHRVKNNLQIVSSLLDLQSQQIQELTMQAMFRDSHSRVKSMALVHENLYQSKNYARVSFNDYIQSLTDHLFQAYGINNERISLELELDELTLNIDTAIPCGLIINELISNALKYAFPNRNQGTIYIALHGGEDEPYRIIVRDNGIGLPLNWQSQAANTLGLQLVQILAQQLEGTLEVNSSDGAEFRLTFNQEL